MDSPAQTYTGIVTSKEQLSPKVFLFHISLQTPSTMQFRAGQFINVDVGEKITRQYSIASSASKTDSLRIVVDIAPGGPGSQYFSKLMVGDHLTFKGPMGKFGLASETGDVIFLAAGTGIAPFRSMIDSIIENQIETSNLNQRSIYLYLSFRYVTDIFWNDYFEKLEKDTINFHFQLTLSQPDSAWNGCQGYVQSCVDRQLFKKPDSQFYICGGAQMVKGVTAYLREQRIADTQIHFEPF